MLSAVVLVTQASGTRIKPQMHCKVKAREAKLIISMEFSLNVFCFSYNGKDTGDRIGC